MKFFLRLVPFCAVLLALTAVPAFAHDALKRSSPAKNAEVSADSVTEIELEFTAGVKFPFVVLRDARGTQIPLGKPRLAGPKVLAEVGGELAAGEHVIAWRVVSSDGHPIEGEIPFRVKGSSVSSTPSVSSEPSVSSPDPTASSTGEEPAAGGPSASAPAAGASAGVPGWIWGVLAVLVALGAFVGRKGFVRAARRSPDGEDADAG